MRAIKPLLLAVLLALPVWAALADSAFQTNDLASLNLGSVGEFWNDDKPEAHQDHGNFQRDPAYLGGSTLRGKNKAIAVAVFRSEAEAVKAMEALRADVASVIQPGGTNEFSGKWWFTSGIPNAVFVNYQNTIVTVSCYQSSFAESGALLQKTAASVIDRIKTAAMASNMRMGGSSLREACQFSAHSQPEFSHPFNSASNRSSGSPTTLLNEPEISSMIRSPCS